MNGYVKIRLLLTQVKPVICLPCWYKARLAVVYLVSLVTTALVGSPPSAYIATAVKHEVDPFRAIAGFSEATPGYRRKICEPR